MAIFEVTPEDIVRLNDVDLRQLVGYVAEQEAIRLGGSPAAVTYGGHQNAADGGIDVSVDLGVANAGGYIPRSQCGYQVKAEDMAAADILAEMKPTGVLRPSIIELGKVGGAYIIVSSKGTVSNTGLSARRNAMSGAIQGIPEIQGLHLDFYDRTRLATWVNQNPGLVPWVLLRTGRALSGWKPYQDWSSSPSPIETEYLLDNGVRLVGTQLANRDGLAALEGIERVRQTLSGENGVVRLVGLSGVGKTRFVQALFDSRIGAHGLAPTSAVYTDIADGPDPLPLDLVTRLQDLNQKCVLIVDNCGAELHRKLSAKVRNGKSGISLITVEYDISDDEPEGTEVFKLEPASAEVIDRILKLKHPQLSSPERQTIASFSEGNSRVALVLADTASTGESLAGLKDGELFKRLFRQRNEENPALLKAAKVCSLVYSFDGEALSGDGAELPILASLAGQSVDDFYGHVAELHRRQLVQKRSKWRAFLPHALAHRLAKQALEDIPLQHIKEHFTQNVPDRLLLSFSRRLGQLHESEAAQTLAKSWLEPGGWISATETLNPLGLAVFENIAPINPDAVFLAIRAALGRVDQNETEGPLGEKLAQLLRSLAYDAAHFKEATRLIGSLVSGEPSTSSSDAAHVFKSLFFIYLSGTHATADQRAELLGELAASGSVRDQALALSGLDAMLETGHFSSMYSFDFGSRKRDFGYHPKTRGDVTAWYKTAFQLCRTLEAMPSLKNKVRIQFGRDLRHLANNLSLVDDLIRVADGFAANGGWPEGWVAARGAVNTLKRAKRFNEAARFTELAERLRPQTLAEKISSYVLPERWNVSDVAEIDFDDEKKYQKAQIQVEEICKSIGRELAADPKALAVHLNDLLLNKTGRVWSVFAAIAGAAASPADTWAGIQNAYSVLDPKIRSHQALCGFIQGLAQRDMEIAESILDDALNTPALHDVLVRMHGGAGLTERGVARLIAATQIETVPTWSFSYLGVGRSSDGLQGSQIRPLLAAISQRDEGANVAVDILSMRAFSFKSDGKEFDADDKAAGRDLLSGLTLGRKRRAEGHAVAGLVKACLTEPKDAVFARQLCEMLLEGFEDASIQPWDYDELVAALAERFPTVVLDVLVEQARQANGWRRTFLEDLREANPCPLDKITDDQLIAWANEGPDSRYGYAAASIRAWKNADGTANDEDAGRLVWSNTALRLIKEAPEPTVVLSAFFDRFHPNGWSGSLAAILESRMALLDQLEGNADPRVVEWAKKVRPIHAENLRRTQEGEVRESRARDEKFDW